MKLLVIRSLLLFFLIPPAAGAQQHIFPEHIYGNGEAPPLQYLLQEALEQNPGLESLRYREQAAEQRIDQRQAWAPPVVQYRYNPMAVGSPEGITYTNSSIVNLSQSVPFPGKIRSQVDVEEARYRMTTEERAYRALELSEKVKRVYYQLWLIQKKAEINSELQSLLDDFIRSAEQRYEVDRMDLESILSAQTEQAKFRTEERTLLNEYRKMLVTFNQLLDRDPETPLGRIADLPQELLPGERSGLEQTALMRRPDLQALEYAVEMNEAEIRQARSNHYPDVMVDVMYMHMPGEMASRFGAMVSVQIPLAPWSGNRVTSRLGEVQWQRQAAEKSLENRTTEARAEIRQTLLDLETWLDVIRLYREEVLPKAEQTTQSAIAAFEAGTTEYLFLIDSLRRLETLRREYYEAQAEFHKTTAKLERQTGTGF